MPVSMNDENPPHIYPLLSLPFYHTDDDEFQTLFNDLPLSCNHTPSNDMSSYVYNVLDFEDNESVNPLSAVDPDYNFYHPMYDMNFSTSDYYCDEDFNAMYENGNVSPCTSFLHLNVRSIPSNLNNLENYLSLLEHKFQIIALTETWLQPHNKDIYNICGYNHEYKIREGKKGGGVSLFISNDLHYVVREDLSLSNSLFESLFIEITTCGNKLDSSILVGVIYRPPNSPLNEYCISMTDLLNVIKPDKKTCYIMGDMNVDLMKVNNHIPTSDFLEIMHAYGYFPLITKPTRITDFSSTLIDNIFCNNFQEIGHKSGILLTDISDHLPIFCINSNTIFPNSECHTTFRALNSCNITKFNQKLSQKKWDHVMEKDNAQESFSLFHKEFVMIFNDCFPLKKSVLYKRRKKWLSVGLKHSIKVKNKLYIKAMKYPTFTNKNTYNKYKQVLKRVLKQAEKDHYDSAFQNYKNDLKKSWKVMNEAINKNAITPLSSQFKINGKIETDKSLIANHFNDYFVNIGCDLAEKIPSVTSNSMANIQTQVSNSIVIEPVTESETNNVISQLKNSSPGWDDLPSMLLKNSSGYILNVLTNIFNKSLIQGIVPNELKVAKIIPLFKSGNKELISNYRPISLLPCLSKVLEKIVYNRIIDFVEKYNIICCEQFGFRKKHGPNLALDVLINAIVSANEKRQSVVGVFVDLSKAFDTLNHDILLNKLYQYGIRGSLYTWIKSYLTNRKQFVCYKDLNSICKPVVCGVPQGSILGPLLFLLYINDIVNVSNKVNMILFADDTNVFMSGENTDEIIQSINVELEKIHQWLCLNKLSLNVTKTQYIVFNVRRNCSPPSKHVYIDNKIVSQVYSTLFLGVKLDSKLLWNEHIQMIKNKISKNIGIILKVKHLFHVSTLRTLYFSFIHPYLTYCIEVWGKAAKVYLDSLYRLQKLCCRLISNSPRRTESMPLFKQLNILNVYQLYTYSISLIMLKFHNGTLPKLIKEYFTYRIEMSDVITRQNNQLIIPLFKSKLGQNSLAFTGVKIWNKIISIMDVYVSQNVFKKKIKCILFENKL